MSATLNLIKAFKALYCKTEQEDGLPPDWVFPDSLEKPTTKPVISRWAFLQSYFPKNESLEEELNGMNDSLFEAVQVYPGDATNTIKRLKSEVERQYISKFVSLPDSEMIENCINFHWYDLMYNIKHRLPDEGLSLCPRFPPYHLIFAYLIENSRIIPIFERVILKFMTGEDLGHASPFTAHWIRNTQSLFYKDSHIPNFRSLNSALLPSFDANRRNAYHRLFGLELSHGNQDNSPVNYIKSAHANEKFVPLLENFLREIWQGIINKKNSSGPNETDTIALADTAKLLRECLMSRRNANNDLAEYETSNLSKEEFFSVIMLEWFYQAIATNTDLVIDLNAEAGTPDERLLKIGKQVGIIPHSKTRDLFALAPLLASFLRMVEEGNYDDSSNIEQLFDTSRSDTVGHNIALIITLWQKATGRNLKQKPNSPYAINGNSQRVSQAMVLK